MSESQILRRVFIGLAAILLLCAVRNYLVYLLSDTKWCRYLCPSAFGYQAVGELLGLKQLFSVQQWLTAVPQKLVDKVVADQWGLFTYLVAAPVVEEVIYRGPWYLMRSHSNRPVWWILGLIAVLVFALSHGRSGFALLPLLALGACNLWLLATSERFWPALLLHFLHNFFFVSVMLYQSPWITD